MRRPEGAPGAAAAQAPRFEVEGEGALWVAVDDDDDDEDGTRDRESSAPPPEDLFPLRLEGRGAASLDWEGGLRVFRAGRPLEPGARLRLPTTVSVQGLAAGPARLRLRSPRGAAELALRVVTLRLVRPAGPVDARRDALAITRRIPNDESLPRSPLAPRAGDPEALRVEVEGAGDAATELRIERRAADGSLLGELSLPLRGEGEGERLTPWFRLVGDALDEAAPGTGGRLLRVGLRDAVHARLGAARQSARVGRPGREAGPRAARRARLRVRVVRHQGVPAVGGDDAGAEALAREQVRIANEVWLQCHLGFGPPSEADVAVVDAPPPTLLAVGDGDGLPSRGGAIRFRADDRPIGPIAIPRGLSPAATALRIAAALDAAGFDAHVTVNPRTSHGADGSADVHVRRRGRPVTLAPDGEHPLSTDPRQSVQLGVVDLADGLDTFGNADAAAGTLEERALLHALRDDDPTTLELVIVPAFRRAGRQGEAFIESDGGAIAGAVVLDRRGIHRQRASWTQAHELGHVLLDQPFHPDNVGPDEPWRLMDSDGALPLVTGPKRLTAVECARARHHSRHLLERPAGRPL